MRIASYAEKEPGRFKRGRGWKVNMFGQNSDVPTTDQQAYRIDMSAGMVLDAHLHIVDQFQIFMAGSGKIGRDAADMITVHYADHHTAYGPLVAGEHGMSYLTLRPKTDAGMVMVRSPDIRSKLQPTKRRHRMSPRIVPAIEPVLRDRREALLETVFEEKAGDDGMTAKVLRLGPGMSVPAPATEGTGGYYVVVMSGAMLSGGRPYDRWSVLYAQPGDELPPIEAGPDGLEAIITIFPVRDGWMETLGEDAGKAAADADG